MQNLKIKNIITIIFSAIFVFNIVLPVAFAANPITDSPANDAGWHLVPPCTNDTSGDESAEAECGWDDLISLANRVVVFLVWLSASLAVMAFCYAGFLYMTAFGESGKIEQAHSIFSATITGLFFVLCGWLIIATILKVLVGGKDTAGIGSIVPFQDVKTIQGK